MNTPGLEAFLTMLDQSDGYRPTSFQIDNWSEVSENLSLAFEEIFNPSSMRDVSEVLEEVAQQQNDSEYSKNPSAVEAGGSCRFIVIKGMRVKVIHPGIPEVYVLYEGGDSEC